MGPMVFQSAGKSPTGRRAPAKGVPFGRRNQEQPEFKIKPGGKIREVSWLSALPARWLCGPSSSGWASAGRPAVSTTVLQARSTPAQTAAPTILQTKIHAPDCEGMFSCLKRTTQFPSINSWLWQSSTGDYRRSWPAATLRRSTMHFEKLRGFLNPADIETRRSGWSAVRSGLAATVVDTVDDSHACKRSHQNCSDDFARWCCIAVM